MRNNINKQIRTNFGKIIIERITQSGVGNYFQRKEVFTWRLRMRRGVENA